MRKTRNPAMISTTRVTPARTGTRLRRDRSYGGGPGGGAGGAGGAALRAVPQRAQASAEGSLSRPQVGHPIALAYWCVFPDTCPLPPEVLTRRSVQELLQRGCHSP